MGTLASQFGGETGGERIQRAIDSAANEAGSNVVVVDENGPDDGVWVLESAIELPSHTTLHLEGATLRLADGATDNLLRNADYEDGNEEIHVVGIGEARLDGNGKNQKRIDDGSHETVGIHLYNVETVTLSGFSIGPTENWAIAPENVVDLTVSNIHFAQDGSKLNQDGLHVTGPAERITVTNLTGTCDDDAVIARSGEGLYGEGGDLCGMTVSNVTIRNVHSCGIFRTTAQAGSVIDGVYATNLQMISEEEAGDAALKVGWNGHEDAYRDVTPEEHRNIVIENVGVNRWDGPFCTIQQPVKGLTIRGVRARHTGPLLWNEEHDVVGLTLEDCESTLTGNPPETLMSDFYTNVLNGERWLPEDQYHADVLDDPPGAVTFDHGALRDVTLRDIRFRFDPDGNFDGDGPHPTAVRIAETAAIGGLTIDNCSVYDYSTGVRIDEAADVRRTQCSGVRQSNVNHPWKTEGAAITASENDPEHT
jgi:hypothetical protein